MADSREEYGEKGVHLTRKSKQLNNRNRQGEMQVVQLQAAGGLGWRYSRCRTTAWVMKVRVTACVPVCGDKGRHSGRGGGSMCSGREVTLLSDEVLLLQLTHRGRPGQLRQLPHV